MSIAEKLTTIAEKMDEVYNAGVEAGKSQGGGDVDLWKMVTGDGTRTDFTRAFYGCDYSGAVFSKPVAPTGVIAQCFDQYKGTSLPKNLDFSHAQLSSGNLTNMFKDAKNLTEVYDLKLPTPTAKHFYTFIGCSVLEMVENFRCSEATGFERTFEKCYALKDINIIGTIGQNGFDIHWSTNLSKASILSILNACNIDVTSSPVTITLPSKCIDGATDTESLLSETGDPDLYGAQMSARALGYNIAFA